MRFLIGLAALTYTLRSIGPIGWFIGFMLLVLLCAIFLTLWPVLLVVGIVLGLFAVARYVEKRQARKFG